MASGAGEGCDAQKADGPRVILSSGPGRIHFFDAARSLHQSGVHVRLVTGWVPSRFLARVAATSSAAIGCHKLSRRIAARSIADVLPASQVNSCTLADGITMAAERIGSIGVVPADPARAWAWRRFGQASRRHIRNAEIFHVRSGAGRGAIEQARRLGMKVIVDHSLVHPVQLQAAVEEYENRLLGHCRTKADSLFQSLQLADCDAADLLLVNSDVVRRSFVAAGYPQDRIRVVHLGVHKRFVGIKQCWHSVKTLRILFTGVFGVRKGALPFLETLRVLSERGISFEATVVGQCEDAAEMRSLIPRSLPLQFIPTVPQDRLVGFLRDADVYLFPTLAEGCAQSAMEALAAGLPVVTTEACGLPASLGPPAFRLSDCNASALSDAIIELAGSESLRRNIGLQGTQMIQEHYRWCDYARELTAVYSRLLAGG